MCVACQMNNSLVYKPAALLIDLIQSTAADRPIRLEQILMSLAKWRASESVINMQCAFSIKFKVHSS